MAFDATLRLNIADISTAGINKSMKQVENALDKGSKKADTFSDKISLKTANFAAYTVASGAVLKLANAISSATSEAIRFEKELAKVAQIVGISVNGAKALSSEILDISKSYGLSAVKVAETIKTLTQSGLSFDKARKSAELLAKTTLLSTFDSLSSTTEGLIAIFAQFNLSVKDAERSLSAINSLSKKYAVESADLIDAVKRAGGVFAVTGGKLEDLLAIITTVRSTTRETAETVATGVRTIFTRIQRPQTLAYLNDLGIKLTDVRGNFIGNLEAVKELSSGLERLGIVAGSTQYAEVIQEIAGTRQQSRLIPLLTQTKKLAEATAIANSGLVDTDEDVAKAKQTLAFRIDELRAKFSALVIEVSQSNSFKLLTSTLLNLADSFLSVASALKPLIPILTAFATIKVANTVAKTFRGFKGASSGGPLGFNRGGSVPGVGNGDTVPALLTPGEFVINKKSAESFGYGRLAKINKYAKGGPVQKFATGGGVTGNTISENIDEDLSRGLGNSVKNLNDANKIFDNIVNNLGYIGEQIRSTVTLVPESRDNVSGSFNTNSKKLSVNTNTATTSTVLHETGHAADNVLGGGGRRQRASTQEGTFQYELANLAKEKVKTQLQELKESGKISEKELEYRLRNQEIFADLFATSSPAVQKIITSTTNAAKGMAALEEAIANGDIDRLYGDIDQDIKFQSPAQVTSKSIKEETKSGGQGALTKEVAKLTAEIKEETSINDQLNKEYNNLLNSVRKIDSQIKEGVTGNKAQKRATDIRIAKQEELTKVEEKLYQSELKLEAKNKERETAISKASNIKAKTKEALPKILNTGVPTKPRLTQNDFPGGGNNPKTTGITTGPQLPEENIKATTSSLENLFEASAVLSLGLTTFSKTVLDADSDIAKFMDKFSGELIKNQIALSAASVAGEKAGAGIASFITERKKEGASRKKSIQATINAFGTLAQASAVLYKSIIDANLALEQETQTRLKDAAIKSGDVEGAGKAAAAASDAGNQKISGDIASAGLSAVGGAIGGLLGIFPILAPIAPALAKIGSAIGAFLGTFKGVQNVLIKISDGAISAFNEVIGWFDGDPFPTLTENFEKQKSLAAAEAKAQALFNKSVSEFDKSQKAFSEELKTAKTLGNESDVQNLALGGLNNSLSGTADFRSQLRAEKLKPESEQKEERINNLTEQIDGSIALAKDSIKELAQSLVAGGDTSSDALAKLGASVNQQGDIALQGSGALSALVDSMVSEEVSREAAAAQVLGFARELAATTIAAKASSEAFKEIADFKLSQTDFALAVAGVKNKNRANASNTTPSLKDAQVDTSGILAAGNSIVGLGRSFKNVNDFINQLGKSTQRQIDASVAAADADILNRDKEEASIIAAKTQREAEIRVGKELVAAKNAELEAAKRAAGELYNSIDLELFGTSDQKKEREVGLELAQSVRNNNFSTDNLSDEEKGILSKTIDALGSSVLTKQGDTGDQLKAAIRATKLPSGQNGLASGATTPAQVKSAKEAEKAELAILESEQAIKEADFQNQQKIQEVFKSSVNDFNTAVDRMLGIVPQAEDKSSAAGIKAIPVASAEKEAKLKEEIAAQDKIIQELKLAEESILTKKVNTFGNRYKEVKKSPDQLGVNEKLTLQELGISRKRAEDKKRSLQKEQTNVKPNITPDQIIENNRVRQHAAQFQNVQSFNNGQSIPFKEESKKSEMDVTHSPVDVSVNIVNGEDISKQAIAAAKRAAGQKLLEQSRNQEFGAPSESLV